MPTRAYQDTAQAYQGQGAFAYQGLVGDGALPEKTNYTGPPPRITAPKLAVKLYTGAYRHTHRKL